MKLRDADGNAVVAASRGLLVSNAGGSMEGSLVAGFVVL